jgi:hypothetical protein
MWCGYQKLGNYFCLTVFVDSTLMLWFCIRDDATLGLWMLSLGSLLIFCDSTYWTFVIDVYTRYLIEVNCIKTLFLNLCRTFLLGIWRVDFITVWPQALYQ